MSSRKPAKKLTFWLGGYLTPSLNMIVGRSWPSLKDMKQLAAKALSRAQRQVESALISGQPDPVEASPRLIVCFTRYACRILDVDNGAGGCKFLCDALRYAKFIPDDNPDCIDFQFRQVRVNTRAEEGMMIEIESSDAPRPSVPSPAALLIVPLETDLGRDMD